VGLRAAFFAATLLAASLAAASAEQPVENIYRLPIGDPARRDREAPVVLDAITDTSTAAVLTPIELPKRLEGVRLLLVGESHTDMDAHRVQKRVLEELVRAGRRVTVALEMYPYTEQAALDDWISGKLTEDAFLDASRWYRSWGYNWLYYRDILLFARDRRLPLVAINAPRDVVSAVRRKGFQNLTPEEAAHIPIDVDSKNAEHLRLFRASFGESGFHVGTDEGVWQSMLDAQCTWDATMGFHAVQPLRSDEDPRAIVVVLVGAGHVQYGLGIERQVRRTFRGRIASLIPVPVRSADPDLGAIPSVQASYASFVWGIPPEGDPLYPDLGIATRVRAEDGLLEVLDVEKESPASAAGLKFGDRLLTLDGVPVKDREVLAKAMAGKRWGDSAELTVRREGESVTVPVLLRRTPPKAD
jgi:uncharacterized iron-regulated protein